MAFKTGCALGVKLPVMNLTVTFQAPGREPGEILDRITPLIRAHMAVPAGLFPVCPFKQVARSVMIKGNIAPPGVPVAGQALLIGIVLLIQYLSMDVLMAVAALFTDLPEFPALIFTVAVETGYCLVGSSQGKGSVVVPFDGVQSGGKSLFGVALGTVG